MVRTLVGSFPKHGGLRDLLLYRLMLPPTGDHITVRTTLDYYSKRRFLSLLLGDRRDDKTTENLLYNCPA